MSSPFDPQVKERDDQVVQALDRLVRVGRVPTVREICKLTEQPQSVVFNRLRRLVKQGRAEMYHGHYFPPRTVYVHPGGDAVSWIFHDKEKK